MTQEVDRLAGFLFRVSFKMGTSASNSQGGTAPQNISGGIWLLPRDHRFDRLIRGSDVLRSHFSKFFVRSRLRF